MTRCWDGRWGGGLSERVMECTQHPCDLLEQWGDLAIGVETDWSSTDHCDSSSCIALETACNAEGSDAGPDLLALHLAANDECQVARVIERPLERTLNLRLGSGAQNIF